MQQRVERHDFASDNTAGICPEALAALQEANKGAAASYGEDRWTELLRARMREIFEADCDVYLAFNGTAANALALAQFCQPFHSVICHELAHIHTDECGAPEFFTNGSKLLVVGSANGKIDVAKVEGILAACHGVHSHKPKAISVTQATELGTVYRAHDIAEVSDFARRHDMLVQMDGARFANAVAHLECAPKEITWEAGVDVLCFGGIKNGLAAGELVVFFKQESAREFEYRLKQAGQLASKMRFMAAAWLGILKDNVWLQNARQANRAAMDLAERLRGEAQIEPVFPVESNAVFLRLQAETAAKLHERGWRFYKFIEPDVYRLMCAWSTHPDDMADLAADLKSVRSAEAVALEAEICNKDKR
jgi:threonine aldolase